MIEIFLEHRGDGNLYFNDHVVFTSKDLAKFQCVITERIDADYLDPLKYTCLQCQNAVYWYWAYPKFIMLFRVMGGLKFVENGETINFGQNKVEVYLRYPLKPKDYSRYNKLLVSY